MVPGAGAFEVAVNAALTEFKKTVKGRARLGVQVTNTEVDIIFPVQSYSAVKGAMPRYIEFFFLVFFGP